MVDFVDKSSQLISKELKILTKDLQTSEHKAQKLISQELEQLVRKTKKKFSQEERQRFENRALHWLSQQTRELQGTLERLQHKVGSWTTHQIHEGRVVLSEEIKQVKNDISSIEHETAAWLRKNIPIIKEDMQKSGKWLAEETHELARNTQEAARKSGKWMAQKTHDTGENLQETSRESITWTTEKLVPKVQRFVNKELHTLKQGLHDAEQWLAEEVEEGAEWTATELPKAQRFVNKELHTLKQGVHDTERWLAEELHGLTESRKELQQKGGEAAAKGVRTTQHVVAQQAQALKGGLAHLKATIQAIEEKGPRWTSKEARALKQGLAHLKNNIGNIETKSSEWFSDTAETVEEGFGKSSEWISNKVETVEEEFEKGSKWISKEFKSLTKKPRPVIEEKEEYVEKEEVKPVHPAQPFASKEINKLKHDVHSAERWIAEKAHQGGSWTAEEVEALKQGLVNIKEGIQHLESKTGSWVSKEARAIKHGFHDVGEDVHDVQDKVARKISDLLKSYPEGITIAGIMKKLDLARHTVLARLHSLVGKGVVGIRKINMAKLHFWKAPKKEKEVGVEKVTVVPLAEEHITKGEAVVPKAINIEKIKAEIKADLQRELREGRIEKEEVQIQEQRLPIKKIIERAKEITKPISKQKVITGVEGLDALFDDGIPRGATVLIAGGAGSGKTLLALQIMAYHASHGKKCLYMSFEESEERLRQHMTDFGWKPEKLEASGNLKLQRFNPFDITRNVDALLMKAKGELLIDVEPIILPENYRPDYIVVDSLTAIASAFTEKEDSYRIYIEQLFRFFENIDATSFLVAETKQIPTIFSQTGVEEFLADGVVVLYNIKRGNVREKAIEVLKMRGAHHEKRIVAFEIADKGVVVYPEQEVFGEIGEEE